MPFIAAIIAVGGTGVGLQMKGQHEAGKAAVAQSKSQNAWNVFNAELAERDATEAREAAADEESKFRKGGERLKARQRMLYAKAGVTPEGSPDEVFDETDFELEKDALNIRRSGQLQSQRYTAQAGLERMVGKSALLRGTAARRASRWNMASTGLSGAGTLGYQYGSMTGKFP